MTEPSPEPSAPAAPDDPTGSPMALKIAAGVAAIATAILAAWLQQAEIPTETIAAATAVVIGFSGRVFPSIAPRLAAVRNDPMAVVTTVVVAAVPAILRLMGVDDGAMTLIAGALGLASSGVIPSLRDTPRVRGLAGRHVSSA